MGFGDFDDICSKAALPLCPLVGPPNAFTGTQGIQPLCYSRSISLANTIIFQGAAGFAHILALIMTVIMIIHVRSKFTAVGESTYPLTRRGRFVGGTFDNRSWAAGAIPTIKRWRRAHGQAKPELTHFQAGRRSPRSSTCTSCFPSFP